MNNKEITCIETYTILDKEYKVYVVNYNGTTYHVGEYKLHTLIESLIEVEMYYDVRVYVDEYDNSISLCSLDNEIYCFMEDKIDNPTIDDIIKNIGECN